MARRTYNRAPAEVPDHIQRPDWAELLDKALSVEGSLGTTYRRMWQYSTSNCAFLLMQGCPMEPIATFKRWQSVNRQVTRGARAFYINRPINVKTGQVDEETGEDKMIQRFKPVKSIFPVSMTEGEPLPEVELPEWSRSRALSALAIRQVAFESFDNNTQGHSIGRDIAINPVARFPEKTLAHELAHVVLSHTTPEAHDDYVRHRGIKEYEAEGTAHIVMNELGLLTPEMATVSRGYLQQWMEGNKPAETSIRAIFKAADTILAAGREPLEDDQALTA